MAVGSLSHVYHYSYPSELRNGRGSGPPAMELATSQVHSEHPYFFQGQMVRPWLTAQALRLLAKVVGSRFHLPPAMLKRTLALSDPVVTSGGGTLRFEGFSGCCSTYARVDLTPDAYRGVVTGEGTTNVDFNPPFRASLAAIREGESMSLAVGRDEVALLHGMEQTVERKVDLPFRWLKGFCEVQAFQSRMHPAHEIGRAETMAFLRSLPASVPARTVFHIVSAGRGLRVSRQAAAGSVKVAGIERLRILTDLAPLAEGLKVYADPVSGASEWVLKLGPLQLCLALSPESWRGFSGEGQVLQSLAVDPPDDLLGRLRSALKWQAELRPAEFALNWDIDRAAVDAALSRLASRGLAGFDVTSGAYFHRELPFDLETVDQVHPRLEQARKLQAGGAVAITSRNGTSIEAEVRSNDTNYRVKLEGESGRCNCPWYAKHDNARGPCKHQLAVRLAAGEDDDA